MGMRFFVVCALVFITACGGGDDGAAPGAAAPTLTSITVSPAGANIGVGQRQTISAEARDQHGAVMPGVAFSWASSDSGVAIVIDGVATGVTAGSAGITASSAGVTSNAAQLTVAALAKGSVVIDKGSVFFAAIGQATRLSAAAFDALGAPSGGNVTWTSSAPDKVSVDAAGEVVSRAIGSALIVAEAGGVRSAPTLVIVAQPMPGALLVTDAQVLSVGPPLGPPGVGTQYEVVLINVNAPAPGTVVLAAETAPVAGKVVATRAGASGLVVTLALAPLHQLFTDYDIRFHIDLSAFVMEAVPERAAALRAPWGPSQRARAQAQAQGRVRPLDAFEPFKAWKCDASIKAQLLGTPPIQLALENTLHLVLEDRPGYSKHALEGSAAIVGTAGLNLKAGFKASGRCDAQGQIKFPVFGWFSVLAMPAVRFGLGAEVEGEILLVQGELGVEGRVGFSPQVGWECGGAVAACRALDEIPLDNQFKTKTKIPSENDMQADVSAQFYVIAGLDASVFLGVVNAGLLEARVGPKQSFKLAFEEDQAARRDFASTYDLKIEGVVEPGEALKKAIEAVIGDDSTGVKFKAEFSTDLSQSPKGNLAVNKTEVRPGAAVDFTVDLDPTTVEYTLLGYNVVGVQLYRKRDDQSEFTPWKFMDMIHTHRATYQWKPAANEVGTYEFAAFVETKIPVGLLEVAADSIRTVEVLCALPGAAPFRARVHAAGNGPRAKPQASTCADSWAGTASYIAKTPGLPTANIAATANITWTFDPQLSGNGATYYTASGTFTLAFNNPDACTTVLTPNTFVIVPSVVTPSRLGIVNDGFNPPTYGLGGAQLVDFTTTVSCPGRDPVVSELRGFHAHFAFGHGPFTVGQERLNGSFDDGAVEAQWDFSRQ
jgi:hypothetical protein